MIIKYIFSALFIIFGIFLLKEDSYSVMGYLFLFIAFIPFISKIFKKNTSDSEEIFFDSFLNNDLDNDSLDIGSSD